MSKKRPSITLLLLSRIFMDIPTHDSGYARGHYSIAEKQEPQGIVQAR